MAKQRGHLRTSFIDHRSVNATAADTKASLRDGKCHQSCCLCLLDAFVKQMGIDRARSRE